MSEKKMVRRMRILEYVGPEEWVLATTENEGRYVKSMTSFTHRQYIREYLGPVEVLEPTYPGHQELKDEEIPF